MNNKKVGVFDSGIGGVTVLNEIIKILPNEDYIYYSDSKNIPYGDKSKDRIIEICEQNVKYLMNEGAKIIVIACNTASAEAVKYLRNKFSNINFVAIEPAYKMVYDFAYEDETLIMATKGTLESEKFAELFEKYNNNKTNMVSCIGLADVIENGTKKEILENLTNNIGKYKGRIKNVVLGCTHYPLIKEEIKEVLGDVEFFEGSKRLAIHLKDVLQRKNMLESNSGDVKFKDSSDLKEKEERFFKLLRK